MISLSRAAVRTRQGAGARIGSQGAPDDPASRTSRPQPLQGGGLYRKEQVGAIRRAAEKTKGAALAAPSMSRPGTSVSGPTGPAGGPVFIPNAQRRGVGVSTFGVADQARMANLPPTSFNQAETPFPVPETMNAGAVSQLRYRARPNSNAGLQCEALSVPFGSRTLRVNRDEDPWV